MYIYIYSFKFQRNCNRWRFVSCFCNFPTMFQNHHHRSNHCFCFWKINPGRSEGGKVEINEADPLEWTSTSKVEYVWTKVSHDVWSKCSFLWIWTIWTVEFSWFKLAIGRNRRQPNIAVQQRRIKQDVYFDLRRRHCEIWNLWLSRVDFSPAILRIFSHVEGYQTFRLIQTGVIMTHYSRCTVVSQNR